jgi:NAD(P)-dependent dehydrogenase (short-subunit alcohol dehydrogenase family)
MDRLLVVGVRPGSLGWRIAIRAELAGWVVDKVDIQPYRDAGVLRLDVTDLAAIEDFWESAPDYRAVVYAAGVNHEDTVLDEDWLGISAAHMAVNFTGALEMLGQWARLGTAGFGRSFVTIASNSAHIPRSTAMSYCASKAAVVMAMRCAARDIALHNPGRFPAIYTYSPGWIADTPMSQEVMERLGGADPHRIPGLPLGVDTYSLVDIVVHNLGLPDVRFLNGTDIRLDGGEL